MRRGENHCISDARSRTLAYNRLSCRLQALGALDQALSLSSQLRMKCPLPTIADMRPIVEVGSMSDDNLNWLMRWYLDQCDNDWEHSYGVEIGTLDNPGWTLKINLRDTALKGRTFKKITQGEPAGNLDEWRRTGSWWVADVKDGAFEAACGPLDLPSVVSVFREWAESDPQA